MPKTLKLFGERIAVKQAKEETESTIEIVAESYTKMGEVFAIADGKYNDGTQKTMYVNVGDTILHSALPTNTSFEFEGEKINIFHQSDAYAKVSGKRVTIEDFTILGDWVLLSSEVKQKGEIVVPEKYAPLDEVMFYLEQKGDGCHTLEGVEKGTQVYPEVGKLFPIFVGGLPYFYTLGHFINGASVESIA